MSVRTGGGTEEAGLVHQIWLIASIPAGSKSMSIGLWDRLNFPGQASMPGQSETQVDNRRRADTFQSSLQALAEHIDEPAAGTDHGAVEVEQPAAPHPGAHPETGFPQQTPWVQRKLKGTVQCELHKKITRCKTNEGAAQDCRRPDIL
ncbi:predicted protein [Histoplasma mississippiense (nom. inval.)]|uniref:predicted protein n=1 Tax=Ajellomyces capsulatus (strain NAm1 / WU24) TaxID=2059318 RepID=UPI000157C546|nr:predicted protein [Histoplasma mississippiense (nom. inval.)]EDN08739.1 predicted protein [Histoplasma mississippiense (nom. inval.)]